MKNPQKICLISPEVSPFVRKSNVSEIVSPLAIALKELGHDVRVMMPNYKCVNERKYILRDVIRLKDMEVKFADREIKVSAKSAFLPDSKVQIYFLDNKAYFGREGLYAEPKTGKEFPDNDERFAAFCYGCIQTLRMLHWQPDVIHCFEWPTGILPLFLKTKLANDDFFANTKIVFSVDNFDAKGCLDAESIKKLGLPEDLFYSGSEIEYQGKLSLLKSGISKSDLIILNSESYLQDFLQEQANTVEFADTLKAYRKKFVGIGEGIDDKKWDPETDPHLVENYSSRSLAKKEENKKALLQNFGFTFDSGTPLLAFISPLNEEKGAALLLNGFEKLMSLKVQMIIFGGDESKIQKELKKLVKKFARQAVLLPERTEVLNRQVFAGADIILLPSRLELFDKTPLYSLRYGAIPVVTAAGVLADSISDFDPEKEKGTGFVFRDYSSEAFIEAVNRAIQVYQDSKKWQKLMRNAMKQDFSWEAVATKFTKTYGKILGLKK